MATHDYNIANQSFPATRSDINNALSAIQSSNSAATAPSGTGSTVAGELFYNTTSNKLQIATDANGTFVDVALDSSGNQTVTGTLGVTGVATFTAEAVFNGGIALGDSDKATFGAGDDLEIYHDGSNSIINDAGTGELQLKVGGSTKLSTSSSGATVTGDLTVTGTLIETSSKELKTAILPLESQLDNIMKLNPVSFIKKDTGLPELGFIAEEVQEIYPTVVSEGAKGLNYSRITAVLVSAVKELKDLVDEQAQEIELLKKG